jgi:hypothetical protein
VSARRRRAAGLALLVLSTAVLAACGGDQIACAAGQCGTPVSLTVQPQNSSLVVGVNRISIALLDQQQNPVTATGVTLMLVTPAHQQLPTRPLENISAAYGGIPIYVGIEQFTAPGQYQYQVQGTAAGGGPVSGQAFVTVTDRGPELAVGTTVPALEQKVLTDAGVTISQVDSGVPPDTWHDQTIAGALAAHRPMVLFFGQPGFCPSKTCGPTVSILKQLCTQYCSQFSFQHIEVDFPASVAQVFNNPAFRAFGLQTDPWVYFVNAGGVIADRFEGPVTLDELQGAAQGTLAGRVPAVSLAG